MTFNQNLIDFARETDEFTDLDQDVGSNSEQTRNSLWPSNHNNFSTTPIIERDYFDGFLSDPYTSPKLVQGEEDLSPINATYCSRINDSSHQSIDPFGGDFISENNMNLEAGDAHVDGFASRDIIMIGGSGDEGDYKDFDYYDDEDVGMNNDGNSSPDSPMNNKDNYWSNSAYNTVVRNSEPKQNSNSKVSTKKQVSFKSESIEISTFNNGGVLKKPTLINNGNISTDTKAVIQSYTTVANKIVKPESTTDLCASCSTKVYITERLVIDHSIYHRQCFKCLKCKRLLNMNNFAASGQHLFCETHFVELFRQTESQDTTQNLNSLEQNKDDEVKSSASMKSIMEKFKQLETAVQNNQEANKNKNGKLTNGESSDIKKTSMKEIRGRQFSRKNDSNNANRSLSVDRSRFSGQNFDNQPSVHGDNEDAGIQRQSASPEKFDNDIIKSSVTKEIIEDELPQAGFTKNLLSLWCSIGNTTKTTAVKSKSTSFAIKSNPTNHKAAPMNGAIRSSSFHNLTTINSNPYVTPIDDSSPTKDELPPAKITKTVAAKFQELEHNNITVPAPNKRKSVNDQSNRKYYQPIINGDNLIKPDKENDHQLDSNEMPEVGTTKNLVGFFKSIQQQK